MFLQYMEQFFVMCRQFGMYIWRYLSVSTVIGLLEQLLSAEL